MRFLILAAYPVLTEEDIRAALRYAEHRRDRLRERRKIGVIILRLEDQTPESVNDALAAFFETVGPDVDLTRSLVVTEDDRVRIVR